MHITISNTVNLLQQGVKYDSRYPIAILFSLFVIGAVSGLFLPETLHQKLPDSLEQARLFGRDQVCITI